MGLVGISPEFPAEISCAQQQFVSLNLVFNRPDQTNGYLTLLSLSVGVSESSLVQLSTASFAHYRLQSNPRTCFLFCQCQSLLYSSQDPLNSLLSTTCFTHHYWFFIDLKSPPLPPLLLLSSIHIALAPLQGEKEAWAWHWFLHRLFSSPILYFCFGRWPLPLSFSLSSSPPLFSSLSQSQTWSLVDISEPSRLHELWYLSPQCFLFHLKGCNLKIQALIYSAAV